MDNLIYNDITKLYAQYTKSLWGLNHTTSNPVKILQKESKPMIANPKVHVYMNCLQIYKIDLK